MQGRIIFFDKIDGSLILDTGERFFSTVRHDADYFISRYKDLYGRNRDTFDYIELGYGQYSQDFAECRSYRVNPETREIEFSYPDPNEPDVEQPHRAPLSEEVEQLKETNTLLTSELAKVKIDLMLMKGGAS